MLNLKSTRLYFFSIIKLAYSKFKFFYYKSNYYNKSLETYEPSRFSYTPSSFLISPLISSDNGIYQINNISPDSIWENNIVNNLEFENLHSFLWLLKIDRKDNKFSTQSIINSWINKYYNYDSKSWNMVITAKRIIAWTSNAEITLYKSDNYYKKRFFLSLIKQSNFLLKNTKNLPLDSNKIICFSAIILSGLIFKENNLNFEYGMRELEKMITIFFDKSGFPKSRNPEEVFIVIKYLILIREWLKESQKPLPEFLNNIILNCGKCYNFLKNSNRKLPLFNGANETDHGKYDIFLKTLKYNFKTDDNEISNFYKIIDNKIELFFDAGNPPSNRFSNNYQAGCLSFELISKGEKIICNAGYNKHLNPKLALVSRSTAAHSTLYLNDTSTSLFEKNETIRKAYGNSLIQSHKILEKKLSKNEKNYELFATHNGYEKRYGYLHKRTIKLLKKENKICGTDELKRTKNVFSPIYYFIRFHIYPGIKIVKTQGKNSVLVKQPNGEGWIIKSIENNLNIEKSIFFGRKNIVNNECVCISGSTKEPEISVNWEIEKVK